VTAAYDASAGFGFAVDDVLVEGRVRSDSGAILKALGVERGTPILSIDPAAAQARLEALPWVSRAAVERRLPRIVYLRLTERRPMALWQLDGEISVIDQNGAVIPGVQSSRFAELPLVVGEGAAAHAAALLAMLDREPEFKPLVMAAVRVGSRRWNLRLRGGIDVRLPETEAAAAWAQFAKLEREHGLLARDVIAIDLRLPDRLVVRMAPDAKLGDEADTKRNENGPRQNAQRSDRRPRRGQQQDLLLYRQGRGQRPAARPRHRPAGEPRREERHGGRHGGLRGRNPEGGACRRADGG
jgi:cell division protein FtsQ